MVYITKNELETYIKAFYKLKALEQGGVDNWNWYGESVCDFLNTYWETYADELIEFFNLTTEEEIEIFEDEFDFSDMYLALGYLSGSSFIELDNTSCPGYARKLIGSPAQSLTRLFPIAADGTVSNNQEIQFKGRLEVLPLGV